MLLATEDEWARSALSSRVRRLTCIVMLETVFKSHVFQSEYAVQKLLDLLLLLVLSPTPYAVQQVSWAADDG